MDWVFKASSSWELTELEREELDVLVMEKNQNMEDLSVDCGMLGDWDKWKEQTPPSPTPCGSSKRPRGNGNEQQVSCLVDGCKADLSSCRDYHRRHRVCEAHSKTPVVAIGGKDQRFCQQCSRFHSVGEFDEVKRSCRKRLDGHNRRRRKPKSSMYMNNYDTFFTTHHRGTKLLRFGGSPAYTGTSALSWPHREKPKQQFHVSVVQPSSLTSREKKFPFLLGPDHTNASSSSAHQTSVQPPKGGALSLLSKHTNTIQPPSTPNPINFNFNHHVDHLPLTNVPGSNNHYIGMIHFRTEGSLPENEAPQALSFSWGELEL